MPPSANIFADARRHLHTYLQPTATPCLLVSPHFVRRDEDVVDGGQANFCRFFGYQLRGAHVNIGRFFGKEFSDKSHRGVFENSRRFSRGVVLNHSTLRIAGIPGDVSDLEGSAVGHAQVTAHVLQIYRMVW